MAGEWIKMRTNLWDDPRVSRLCDLTDAGEAAIVGGLYWLWAMADEHTEDGILPGLTTRAIDRKTGVTGLGEALCKIGWLADHPDGVRIVGFEEHNGASAKRRCQDAQRKANGRKDSASSSDDVQQMSASQADKQKTEIGQEKPDCGAREEKRREEKKEEKTNTARAPRKPATNLEIADLVAEGVDLQHAKDWRTARKCPITQTAWDELKAEAVKAGITPAEAVRICAVKGWRGFDASWRWQGNARASPITPSSTTAEAARLLGFTDDEVIDA